MTSRRPALAVVVNTREQILATAERLFALDGFSVSSRQIAEAAGQGNNSVVGYHFGTKADLALAIVRLHGPDIERRRVAWAHRMPSNPTLGAWLQLVVHPITEHLESLGTPSFHARFVAHASSHPALRPLLHDEFLAASSMRKPFQAVSRMLRHLPAHVFAERAEMTRNIVVSSCAERERALHEGTPTLRATWADTATGIVDALGGLWGAPVTALRRRK